MNRRVLICIATALFAVGCGKNDTRIGTEDPNCKPQCSGKACGPDGCGGTCGECSSGLLCNTASGTCVTCLAETDAELCANAGYACGELKAADGCGAARTVASCGACSEGLECSADLHTCECTAETDAAFCARLHKQCGALTERDNCGNQRTVSDCGACQQGWECNPDGQCDCVNDAEALLCLNAGYDCGSPTLTDHCGTTWSDTNCGECEEPKECDSFHCAYPAHPSNDTCDNARLLAFTDGAIHAKGTTRGAHDDMQSSCGEMAGADDVFYRISLDQPSNIYISVAAAGAGGISVALLDGCGAGAQQVIPCGAKNGNAAIAAKRMLDAGSYVIAVEALGSNVDFTLDILRDPPPAANDLCTGAIALVWDEVHNTATITGDTFLARDDYVSHCSLRAPKLTGGDLVYSFVLGQAASVTATVTRDPTDTSFSPAVSIRRGCADADELVCARETESTIHPGVTGTTSATATLPQGTYYVFVDGVATDGPFTLTVSRDAPITGDGCGNPEPIVINQATGEAVITGDLTTATQSGDSSCVEVPNSGYDKVYSLVLGQEKMVELTLAPAQGSSTLHGNVYIRRDCADVATELACAIGDQYSNAHTAPVRLRAGTYFVWVDATARLFNGPYTLTVKTSDPLNPIAGNDTCAGATTAVASLGATSPSAQIVGDTRDAYDDYSDACSSLATLLTGGDLVYKIELQQAGLLFASVTRDASTPGFLPALYVRSNCAVANSGESTACGTATEAAQPLATLAEPLAAGTYYIIVDGAKGTSGRFTLDLLLDTTPAIPATCNSAEVLEFDGNGVAEVAGDTASATNRGSASCGSGGSNGSAHHPALAYVFSTQAVRDVSITVLPTGNLRPTVYVRSVCDDGLTEEGCGYATSFQAVTLNLTNLPAGDHYIWVGGDQGEGAFRMRVRVAPPPSLANDVCTGAQQITLPAVGSTLQISGSTVSASDDLSGGCATNYYRMAGPDLVYKFTVTAPTRVTATVTPAATSPNYQPAVYLRSLCETTKDDVCTYSQNPGTAATLTASLPNGTWYLVVDGLFATSGDFLLEISQNTATTVSGEACANLQQLQFQAGPNSTAVATISGDTSTATNDYEPSTCFSSGGGDLVYSFVLARESIVTVTVGPTDALSNFTSGFYIRRACADITSEIYCNNTFAPQTSVTGTIAHLQPGTYHLFVDSSGSGAQNNGPFTGTVTVMTQPLPPANNECSAAQSVTLPSAGSPPLVVQGSTVTALNRSAGSCQPNSSPMDGPDVVYTFHVSADTQVFAKVTPSSTSTGFMPAVYIRSACNRPDKEVCKLQYGAGSPLSLAASLSPGDYYLFVDGLSGTLGDFELELSQFTTLYVPGDNCLNARALQFTAGANGSQVATFADDNSSTRSPMALNDGDSCWSGAGDFVWSFTTGQDSYVEVTVGPSGAAPVSPSFYIRTACSDSVTELFCRTAYLSQPETAKLFHLPAGTYYLWVDGPATGMGDLGPFSGTVTVTPMATPPLNDTCATAELLDVSSGSATVTGETGFANDDTTGGCGSGPAPDVVYSFTTTAAQKIEVTLTRDSTTPTYYPVVYIRNACNQSSPSAELSCGQQNWSGVATATVNNAPAGTYYVFVDGMQTAAQPDQPTPGKFTLAVTLSTAVSTAPANDYCPGAIALQFNRGVATVTGNTGSAAADSTGRCTYNAWPDVVYSFELGAARKVVIAEQAGSGQMPAFEVRRACGSMSPSDAITCISPQVPGGRAAATIPSLDAGIYYIWVQTENSNATDTTFTLSVTLDAPDTRVPVNDTCAGAIALQRGLSVAGDTNNAVNDYLGPPFSETCRKMANTYIFMTGPDVVYSYTPTTTGPFTVRVLPASGYLAQIWVTEGVCGSGAACVAMPFQFGGALRTTVAGTAGTTYYIGVDSITLDAVAPIKTGKFTITVQ